MRQQRDFLRDTAAKIGERFLDVGRIVVGFFRILIAVCGQICDAPWPEKCLRDGQQFLMHLLQRIHSLLKLDIFWRKLCLGLQSGPAHCIEYWEHPTFSPACPSCSLTLCIDRWANGVTVEFHAELRVQLAREPTDDASLCFAYLTFLPNAANLFILFMQSTGQECKNWCIAAVLLLTGPSKTGSLRIKPASFRWD